MSCTQQEEEIEKDGSIVFRDYRSGKSGNMVSLLDIAAQKGHFELVGLLLNHGANVNLPLKDGATPLYFAAQYGQKKPWSSTY